MSRQRDLGALWHALAGLGIGAAASFIPDAYGLIVVGAVGVAGWLREVIQHDLRLAWPHQVLEAVAWGAGGLLGWLVLSLATGRLGP